MNFQELITPNGFFITNFGDGKTIELQWSVIDKDHVKYFTLQHYDRHTKKWKPYDGFHGLVQPWLVERDSTPTQKLSVEIPNDQGQHSFRVSATSHDGHTTEWVTASVNITGDIESTESDKYWVRNGLRVNHLEGTRFVVETGIAYMGGIRQALYEDRYVDINTGAGEYIIFISRNGTVSSMPGRTTPPESIRLANVTIGTNGDVTELIDTRFLWAPDDFQVSWSQSSLPTITNVITWQKYEELNLQGFKILRGTVNGQYDTIFTVDKMASEFIDNNALVPGRTYYYSIRAYDWSNNESPILDPPIEIVAGEDNSVGPSAPTGLRVQYYYNDRLLRLGVKVAWDPPPADEQIDHYILLLGDTLDNLLFTQPGTISTHEGYNLRTSEFVLGRRYIYAVRAVDKYGRKSEPSTTFEFPYMLDTRPKVPVWADPMYTTKGGLGQASEITLRWHQVKDNEDGSDATDLFSYMVETIHPDGEITTSYPKLEANDEGIVEYTVGDLYGGYEYNFRVCARGSFGNNSDFIESGPIVAGNTHVPKTPVITSLESLATEESFNSDYVKMTWQFDHEGLGTEDITFLIYRGASDTTLDVIDALSGGIYEWEDHSVSRGQTHYYGIVAANGDGNRSPMTTPISIRVGDYEAPQPPRWVDSPTSEMTLFNNEWVGVNTLHLIPPMSGLEKNLDVYVVEASTKNDGRFVEVGRIPRNEILELPEYDAEPNRQSEGVITFEHFGASYGETWYYRAFARSKNSLESPRTSVISVVTGESEPALNTPVVEAINTYSIENKTAGINLSWNDVEGAERYIVFRSENGSYFVELATTSNISFSDNNLDNGRMYWYRIVAVSPFGQRSEPGEVSLSAGKTFAPKAPRKKDNPVVDLGNNQSIFVDLNWLTPLDVLGDYEDASVESYNIYRASEMAPTYFSLIGSTNDTDFIDASVLFYGVEYTYLIKAVDVFGNEGDPLELSVRIEDTSAIPEVAIHEPHLTYTNDGRYSVTITWSESEAQNFERYEVWGGREGDLRFLTSISNKSSTTFTDTGLLPLKDGDTPYVYGVIVYNSYGVSSALSLSEAIRPIFDTKPANVDPSTFRFGAGYRSILISFDEVTEDENGNMMNFLDSYELVAGNTPDFDIDAVPSELRFTSRIASFQHLVESDDDEWFYAVRVHTIHGTYSDWVYSHTEGPGARSLEEEAEIEPIDPPSNPVVLNTSYIQSASDGSRNYYITIGWSYDNYLPHFNHFNLYMDGTLIARVKNATEYTVNNLLPGTSYVFEIEAEDIYGSVSSKVSTGEVATITKQGLPTAPINPKIVTGTGLFALSWDRILDKDLAYYELECSVTKAAPGGTREWSPWQVIYNGNSTSFTHGGDREEGKLDYDSWYRYRVRSVDTSGNSSSYVRFAGDDIQPKRFGPSDVAYGTVIADHLKSNIVETHHIHTDGIDAGHGAIRNLHGKFIQADTINAQHLNINQGGYNYIRNSAFSLTKLDSDELTDWNIVGNASATEVVDCIVDIKHAIHWKSNGQEQRVSQLIDKTSLPGMNVIASAYVKTADAEGVKMQVMVDGVAVSQADIPANTPWMRLIVEVEMPANIEENVELVFLQETGENTDGDVWITGVQLEVGDVRTAWNPNPNETYSSANQVQISSEGLKITGGKARITLNDNILIDNTGIKAGSDNAYAKLHSGGLLALGGAVEIRSGQEGNEGLVIKKDGLYAYPSGSSSASVVINTSGELTVTNGKFTMTSSSGNNPFISINSSGILGMLNGTTEFFNLDIPGKQVTMSNGAFKLMSGSSDSTSSIILDGEKILLKSPDGEPIFKADSSENKVSINGSFEIKTSHTGPHLVFDSSGIRAVDGENVMFNLSSQGWATFNGGYFLVYSPSTSKRISIDMTNTSGEAGITGPGFKLLESGAHFSDVTIEEAGITLNKDTGLTVTGSKGITVKDGTTEIVKIQGNGISIKKDGGLKLEGGGITFADGETHITPQGINAEALNTGKLTIEENGIGISVLGRDADNNPAEVVTIDDKGVNIYHGRLNVFDVKNGRNIKLMEDGKIQASALNIGAGGSNLVYNGRAEFPIEESPWERTTANTSVLNFRIVDKFDNGTPASRSGNYAFRLQVNRNVVDTVIEGIYQDLKLMNNQVYHFSCWAKSDSGTFKISVKNAYPYEESQIEQEFVNNSEWVEISFPFIAGDNTRLFIEGIVHSDITQPTVGYITDISVTRGPLKGEFSPHSEEVSAGDHVLISQEGVKITGGKLDVSGLDGNIRINSQGIAGSNFSMGASGFALNYDNHGLRFNSTEGLVVEKDTNNKMTINSNGITILGGMLEIIDSTGQDGQTMSITSKEVMAKKNSNTWVKLNPVDGLVIQGSALNIQTDNDDEAHLSITHDGLRFHTRGNKTHDGSVPNISIGKVILKEQGDLGEGGPSDREFEGIAITGTNGIMVDNSHYDEEGVKHLLQIMDSHIRLSKVETDEGGNEVTTASTIIRPGEILFHDGQTESSYARRVTCGVVESGTYVPLNWSESPKVITAVSNLISYNSDEKYKNSTQFYECYADQVEASGFYVYARHTIEGVDKSFTVTNGARSAGQHEWVSDWTEDNSTSIRASWSSSYYDTRRGGFLWLKKYYKFKARYDIEYMRYGDNTWHYYDTIELMFSESTSSASKNHSVRITEDKPQDGQPLPSGRYRIRIIRDASYQGGFSWKVNSWGYSSTEISPNPKDKPAKVMFFALEGGGSGDPIQL